MKFLELFCPLLPLVSCSCIGYDLTFDNLAHSYRKVGDLYSRLGRDGNYDHLHQFVKLHNKLITFVNQSFKPDPEELFKVVRGIGNYQVAHFVVISVSGVQVYWSTWSDYLGKTAISESFFKSSKPLMHKLVKRDDWDRNKKALLVLLSIQRQFLYQLHLDEAKMQGIRSWIEKYEFIYHHFEPGNLDGFLRLFRHLEMSVLKRGKLDPEGDLFTLKLFKLFKLHCHHFYFYHWKRLNASALPLKLLCLILFKTPILTFLKPSGPGFCTIDSSLFKLGVLQNAVMIYEKKTGTKIKDICQSLIGCPEFNRFIRSYIETEENEIPDSVKREFLIVKIALRIIPMLNYKRIDKKS